MNNNELEGESGWVCARAEEMGGRNAGINTISKANEKQPKLSEDTEYNSSYPLEWEGFFLLFSPPSPGRDWMALGHMFWLHGKIHKQRERQEFSLQMTHYLEHVRVFIVCVLHHHGLVPRQSVGYAVLAFAADSLIVRGEKKNSFKSHPSDWSEFCSSSRPPFYQENPALASTGQSCPHAQS